jgi:hypothetical protein
MKNPIVTASTAISEQLCQAATSTGMKDPIVKAANASHFVYCTGFVLRVERLFATLGDWVL